MLADTLDLQNRFVDLWNPTIPVFYDLQNNDDRPADSIWCRFAVRPGSSSHFLGSREHGTMKNLGRVWLQIFVPEQGGSIAALNASEAFAAIFRNWRTDQIQCETEQMSGPFPDKETGMMMFNVSIPYTSFRDY